ncbi:fimbria/pilus outer membrane usher protein, partial [Vibrio cholerae]|uniref:fimbria/pilus outer membrane usher protein n=1 Tax=Vibrio cholerae TaxID=666 RepID=UPI0034D6AD6B
MSMSADGGLIAHGDGLTLSQTLGEASALMYAPGAQGAQIGGGVRIDSHGYGVLPSLRAYHPNDVE